jgi:large subunit ribosomal protein L7e
MVASQIKPKVDGEALKVAKVVLKRRDRNLMANAERAKTIQKLRKLRKSKPKLVDTVNGDVLLRKRRKGELDKKQSIIAKKKQYLEKTIPSDATCLLVARNSRNPDLPRVKESLGRMGVVRHNDCRIIAATPENLNHLRISDAYVYYGVPSAEIISTLVHKKAYVKVAKEQRKKDAESQAKPLNNNAIVEDVLGSYGLICVEDLVEVLAKGKDNIGLFNKVSNFISSFKINQEKRIVGSKFKNDTTTRGFQPKIETIMSRLI